MEFQALNPLTGETLPGVFRDATPAEVEAACRRAEAAFEPYRRLPGSRRAEFLDAVAEAVLAREAPLKARLAAETGYPETRILAERDRTVYQLRLFAGLLREGSWVQARLDSALPDRKPSKPDLRRYFIPIGPVAVFGASNFPQAYSTAGGDTASALAAGCPVVVKAHPAHPGTAQIYAEAVLEGARQTGMPEGVFAQVQGQSHEVGMALVRDPRIKAVGFTGSFRGGKALYDAAACRPEPIPVYAEMGSTNPVFLLPGALRARKREIAAALVDSMTAASGQMCTCPGLFFALRDAEAEAFHGLVLEGLRACPTGSMVHPAVKRGYEASLAEKIALAGVEVSYQAEAPGSWRDTEARPAWLRALASDFLRLDPLREESFGPAGVFMTCQDPEEMLAAARALPGQLTATVHGTEEDLAANAELIRVLEGKAGRLIVNGVPTGLEVCPSTQHGGPFPATMFPHFTSMGTAAIERFVRPICYQDFPPALLPPELQDGNPLGIWRLVDGDWRR